jgi:hypothetical protein
MANGEPWNYTKIIPTLSFVLTLVVQTVSLVVFITILSGNVAVNTDNITSLQEEADLLGRVVQNQEVTLGRIDENIKTIKEFLENASNNN